MYFDEFGYLAPYQIIQTDLVTFESTFVKAFTESGTRAIIFKSYLNYLSQLQQLIGQNFYQWIDGSFVSKKKHPNDIDFVTFIHFESFIKYEKELAKLRKASDMIDCYYVQVFENEHKHRFFYESDKLRWLHFFGRSRDKKQKGIIELNF